MSFCDGINDFRDLGLARNKEKFIFLLLLRYTKTSFLSNIFNEMFWEKEREKDYQAIFAQRLLIIFFSPF